MPINWFTVAAQAVNFLILVWLLKRFLYKPILHAIDEREKGIADQLAQAEAKKAEAQKERDDFQHKNEAIDQERAALLKKAADEARAERQRLFDEVRGDADRLRARRQEALRNEQQNLNQEIMRWTQKQVFAITRQTLTDLAAVSLEECMGAVFVQRVRALTGAAREQLAASLKASNHPARVRSAFDLPPRQREAIIQAVNETFSADIPIQFDTVPDVVSGIELTANGHKVAWSIADYLATLEKSVALILHEDAGPEARSGPEPKAPSERKAVSQGMPNGAPEAAASAPKAKN